MNSSAASRPTMGEFRVNPQFSWKRLAKGFIILDLEKGTYFTLNGTASFIWENITTGLGKGAIAAALAAEYGIPLDQASADVDETLGLLERETVLQAEKSTGT